MTTTITVPIQSRMPRAEARHLLEHIRENLRDVRLQLLALYDREGWRSLGYRSWRELVEAEFSVSLGHLNRLLAAARIERDVTPAAGDVDGTPRSTRYYSELGRLDTADLRREIHNEAVALGVADGVGLACMVDRCLERDAACGAEADATAASIEPPPVDVAQIPPPATPRLVPANWPVRLQRCTETLRAHHARLGRHASAADQALDHYLAIVTDAAAVHGSADVGTAPKGGA